jgi:hypothetical protein
MEYTKEDFTKRLSAWFGHCKESHLMLLDELSLFPWAPDLRYSTVYSSGAPTIKVSQGGNGRHAYLTLTLSASGHEAVWRAELQSSQGELRCSTNDLQTLLFFLQRLPLFAPELYLKGAC